MADTGEIRRPKPGRFRKTGCLSFLGVAILLTLLLGRGLLQKWVFEAAASHALGTHVRVTGVSVLGALRVNRIEVFGSPRPAATDRPTLQIRGIKVSYRLFPPDGRYIRSVSVEYAEVYVAGDMQSSIGFLTPLFSGPPSTSTAFLPHEVAVGAIELTLPDTHVHFGTLRLLATVESPSRFSASLSGDITGTLLGESAGQAPKQFVQGPVDVQIVSDDNGLTVPKCHIALPGVLLAEANAKVRFVDGAAQFEEALDAFTIDSGTILDFLGQEQIPFTPLFRTLDFSGTRFHGEFSAGRFAKLDGDVRMAGKDVRISKGSWNLPIGDFHLRGQVRDARWNGTLTFGAGQDLKTTGALSADEMSLHVAFADWSRDQVMKSPLGALPALRDLVLSIAGLSGQLDLRHTGPHWSADITLRPAVGGDAPKPVELFLQAKAEEKVASQSGKGTSYAVTLNSTLGGKTATLDVDSASVTLAPFRAEGKTRLVLELEPLAALFGWGPLHGITTLEGKTAITSDSVEAPLAIAIQGMGYGSLTMPDDPPLTGNAAVQFDFSTRTGHLTSASVGWGKGTTLRCGATQIRVAPLAVEIPFSLESDLTPLTALGLLDKAEGTATGQGTLRISEPTAVSMNANYVCKAASLVLPGALAQLLDLSAEGRITYEGSDVSGKGDFSLAEIAAVGVRIRQVKGPVTLSKSIVAADKLEGVLYNGTVTASAVVDFGSGRPASRCSAQFANIDLERFTQEFQPPKVKLTGIANGDATVAWGAVGLEDVRVSLESKEGFSMNSDFVMELLSSQFSDSAAGRKTLGRIATAVMGDKPQRPFDSAGLTLGLIDGRLKGQVLLKSNDLNLTIDVHIDPSVIAEAIRLRSTGEFESIRTGPTESSQAAPLK